MDVRVKLFISAIAAIAFLGEGLLLSPLSAQDVDAEKPIRRALLVCGLPGDEEHRTAFAATIESLKTSLVEKHGLSDEQIEILFAGGSEACAVATSDAARSDLAAAAAKLVAETKPDDTVWVILLGHAHYDRRHAWYSLPGADVNEADVGEMFAGLQAKEQVFFVTIPASGYYLKTLSAPGRVLISSTSADLEVNETVFPEFLAKRLNEPVTDIDGDGVESLVDLYIAVARDVAQSYLDKKLLATEHAQLDDNGDGKGTELQIDFLSEAQGGRPAGADKPLKKPSDDGALAATIRVEGRSLADDAIAPTQGDGSDCER